MRVLDATVTRRARGTGRVVGPEQRVDVMTALKAMTIWPAYQHFEEETQGLDRGRQARRLRDPRRGNPLAGRSSMDLITDIEVVETIKEGKSEYRAT
ncbi:MAG: hypothetical protein MZV49_01800 [Rhodopseudomonas palustris]|nr:hypothetical protein [Rhodopseudomonas palustris]